MTIEHFMEGKRYKEFLIMDINDSSYDLTKVKCTDEEIDNGCLKQFGALSDEKYSIYTLYSRDISMKITSLDVGDMIELDNECKLIRLS